MVACFSGVGLHNQITSADFGYDQLKNFGVQFLIRGEILRFSIECVYCVISQFVV